MRCHSLTNTEMPLVNGDGVCQIVNVNGKYALINRIVWEVYNNATLDDGDIIHHISVNRGDNRPSNLIKMKRQDHDRVIHSANLINSVKIIINLKKQIRKLEETICRLSRVKK